MTMTIPTMMKVKTKAMRHFFNKTKKYFKQFMNLKRGDLTYEKFEERNLQNASLM